MTTEFDTTTPSPGPLGPAFLSAFLTLGQVVTAVLIVMECWGARCGTKLVAPLLLLAGLAIGTALATVICVMRIRLAHAEQRSGGVHVVAGLLVIPGGLTTISTLLYLLQVLLSSLSVTGP